MTEGMDNENKEAFYDKEVAPRLLEIGAMCRDARMSFIGVVEFAENERGTTLVLQPGCGLAMTMLAHCDKCGLNIDGYLIGLCRYATEKGIDVSQSLALKRLTDG